MEKNMKKLKSALLVTVASTLLAACGTEELADGKYYFTETHVGDGTSCVINERSIQKDAWIVDIRSEGEGSDKVYFFTPNEELSAPIPSMDEAKMVDGVIDMVAQGPYAKNISSTIYSYKTTVQVEINEDVDNTLWLNKFDVERKSSKKVKNKDWVKKILSSNDKATRVCLAQKSSD